MEQKTSYETRIKLTMNSLDSPLPYTYIILLGILSNLTLLDIVEHVIGFTRLNSPFKNTGIEAVIFYCERFAKIQAKDF